MSSRNPKARTPDQARYKKLRTEVMRSMRELIQHRIRMAGVKRDAARRPASDIAQLVVESVDLWTDDDARKASEFTMDELVKQLMKNELEVHHGR